MEKNAIVHLKITGMTQEGNGVGHHDGMAVFIPDTVPGDLAEVRIVKVLSRYAYGRLERLLETSPDRAEPDCPAWELPVSRRCGGCTLRHLSYKAEKREKWAQVHDAFERIGGFANVTCRPLVSTNITDGYRNKAMLPIRRDPEGHVRIGFFVKRTHDVVECPNCRLQPEEFTVIAQTVRRWIEQDKISCYDEHTGKGLLRHLYLRKAFATGQLMVCFVLNGAQLPHQDHLFALLDALSLPITSISININRNNTNVILGKETIVLRGSEAIEDVLCGVQVRLHPQSFYQVNHDAAQLLYEKAAEYAALTGGETLIDLYCGAGTIGLSMAEKLGEQGHLIGVEVVEDAVRDARRNAAVCGADNARFLCADAGQAAAQLAKEGIDPEVVIVDPPRKGCDENVLEAINAMSPARIVMISCNPATAARDCKRLTEMGWLLQELTPVDLFPRTSHVETVCLLSKP